MIKHDNAPKRSREKILMDIIQAESALRLVQDIDILLEHILTEARRASRADAGSIYILKNNRLFIRHSQNDTLQRKLPPGEKLPYNFFSFPVDTKTIAGCAAHTKELINEPDVYCISEEKPYSFGRTMDTETDYRTVSNLAVPLISRNGNVLGVLQVLNALDNAGQPAAFTDDDELYLTHFASNATNALEHASLTRDMILRMIKMSELRDPKETGGHVNRVSSYAVEIYDRWAFHHNVPASKLEHYRDILKIGSMLHDVGKIAISDNILKKPGKLTDDEFAIMQSHTWLGARLFDPDASELDNISFKIALSHHENWDGTGYPGHISIETGAPLKTDPATGKALGLKGEEIPLCGRIVTIADVFDALSSARVYKKAWTDDDIIDEMKRMIGTKFDPELIKYFFDIFPRIKAIRTRFTEGS